MSRMLSLLLFYAAIYFSQAVEKEAKYVGSGTAKCADNKETCVVLDATSTATTASFKPTEDGTIYGIRLEYDSGYVTCNGEAGQSNWGCWGTDRSDQKRIGVNVIKIATNEAYYPREQTIGFQKIEGAGCSMPPGCAEHVQTWYNLQPYDGTSTAILFNGPSDNVNTNDQFALTYGMACCGTTDGLSGQTKAKVYFLYGNSNYGEIELTQPDNWAPIASNPLMYGFDGFVVSLTGRVHWISPSPAPAPGEPGTYMASLNAGEIGRIPDSDAWPKYTEVIMVTNDRALSISVEILPTGFIRVRSWTVPTSFYTNRQEPRWFYAEQIWIDCGSVHTCKPSVHPDSWDGLFAIASGTGGFFSPPTEFAVENLQYVDLDGITFIAASAMETLSQMLNGLDVNMAYHVAKDVDTDAKKHVDQSPDDNQSTGDKYTQSPYILILVLIILCIAVGIGIAIGLKLISYCCEKKKNQYTKSKSVDADVEA